MFGKYKGFQFTNISDPFNEKQDDETLEDEDKKNKFEALLNVDDVDNITFQELLKKQVSNKTTEKEKLMIEKQMYKLKLGVDELNEDVMKCYYRKTNVIENYIYLLDDDKLFEGNTQHVDEQNTRLTIVRKLINLLGWKHINDDTVYNNDDFQENMINTLMKSQAFTDQKTKIMFNMHKSKVDLKKDFNTIRYINDLIKTFGIKIDVSYNGRREYKNRLFSLKQINNVSEIVHYLITRGKLALNANNYYVKPTQMRFETLFKYQTRVSSSEPLGHQCPRHEKERTNNEMMKLDDDLFED
jgi:hypothetical protein